MDKFSFNDFKKDLQETKEWLQKEYTQISTGRANPVLLDSVMVDSYGTKQPIKSVASIHVEEVRTLRIVPWDRDMIRPIQTAIDNSGLPLSTATDDQGVRVNLPQMTEENKKSILKVIKEKLEDARVTVRSHRQQVEKDIEAADFSKDDTYRYKEEMQKLVDETNKTLEEIYERKEEMLMTI